MNSMRNRKRRYHRRFFICVEHAGYHGWYPFDVVERGFDTRHRKRAAHYDTTLMFRFRPRF